MGTTEGGQALPLGIALLAIGMLGALVLYDTGRVATDKARLVNAADAAAYSGLQWQARALNFQAYTNRAMVANQVSIAQAVSLNSWTTHAAMTGERIASVLGALPIANALSSGLASAMNVVERVAAPMTAAIVRVVDTVNGALSKSQEAMYASAFAATPEIVRDVVAASDPRFEVDTAYSLGGLYGNLERWKTFTESVEPDDVDAMGERGTLVNDSRDDFSRRRYWEFFENFWFMPTLVMRHKVFREGDTRLIMLDGPGGPRWEWKAKDTLALQNRLWRPFRSEKKIELPISWAEAYANGTGGGSVLDERCRRGVARQDPQCAYWTTKNHLSERAAHLEREAISGYHGLRAFRTIAEAMREREDGDPRLKLRIEVAMATDRVRASDRPRPAGAFGTDIVAPGARLSSVSVAEVYYRRPDTQQDRPARPSATWNARERANGYNPYWTVRLAPIAAEERLLALGLRAGGGERRAPGPATPQALAAYGEPGVGGRAEGGDGPDGVGDDGPTGSGGDGRLAGYVDPLAAGLGAEGAASGEPSATYRDVGLGDIAGLAPPDLDPVALLRDELEAALEDAVRNLLTGAVDAATGELDRMAGDLESNPYVAEAREVEAYARDLTEELDALRESVARDFRVALEAGLESLGRRRTRLTEQIAEAEAELSRGNASAREEIEARLRRLRERRDQLRVELRDRLAAELVEIVARYTDVYVMPLRMAEEVVTVILVDIDENGLDGVDVEEGLPW